MSFDACVRCKAFGCFPQCSSRAGGQTAVPVDNDHFPFFIIDPFRPGRCIEANVAMTVFNIFIVI